ncbi:MAG: hypothetical protein ACE361_00845 [Aureliella sp.]
MIFRIPRPTKSKRFDRNRIPSRHGQSMLELVAATTVISIALVPALRLTRESVGRMDELERHEDAVSLCTGKLEEQLAATAANWDLTTVSGDFAAEGRPELQFQVLKSDAVSEGGIPGALAAIHVTVWFDEDGGRDLDANEPRTTFSTKLAKVLSYEYEASVH